MTTDEMKVSNSTAVASIEDASKKAGAEDERNRIAGLQAAFPSDAAFVTEATKAGWSVTEAKAARFDQVAAHNTELQTKNDELSKKLAEQDPNVEFAASDSEANAETVGSDVDEKDATSTEIWNKNGNLRASFHGGKTAFQALYRNDPEMAQEVADKAAKKK